MSTDFRMSHRVIVDVSPKLTPEKRAELEAACDRIAKRIEQRAQLLLERAIVPTPKPTNPDFQVDRITKTYKKVGIQFFPGA